MPRSKSDTRKAIMDAAYALFRKRGYTRVGVDDIADAAGITKRTLYSHFDSKDALLEAVLDAQAGLAFAEFQTFGRKLSGDPRAIVMAFFQELARWSGQPRFPGSGFTRLAMELADLPGHPARRIARRHKRVLETSLADLLGDAGLARPERYARQLWILTEGAIALVLIHGDRRYCQDAEEAALTLLDGALGGVADDLRTGPAPARSPQRSVR